MHKILLDDNHKPTVDAQRRLNQAMKDVVRKEILKWLDAGYNQIAIAPEDQSKTTFTCPYGTFAFRRMPFGLCNAPATFQRCMTAIFSDLNEDCLEIFMDDFSTFGENFDSCLSNLEKISSKGMEVDKAKIEVISKLPPPTTVKGIRSFLGHTDARVEDSAPPSPVEPSAAAEQNRTPPPSPPVILVSSHTTTTSPATTPAAPAERSRGRTPETPLGSTPSSSSPSPSAPAQSKEAGPLQYMMLRSQLQRIEARQLHFQNEVKVFQETLTKFLIFQFPASAAFFGQTSTPPPQPSASAAVAAQPSTHTSAKEGATEEVHFSSDDENDIFDWQSPRDHLLTLGPSTSTPAPAAPILSAAPTPTTAAAVARPTPDSPARKRGKATAGRTFDRGSTSSPDEEEADQRPAKRRRRYHVITVESDEDDSDAEVPVPKPLQSADPSLSPSI
ncbi:hypothetical protein GQ457_13G014300 [Hibiscus cannabinus]